VSSNQRGPIPNLRVRALLSKFVAAQNAHDIKAVGRDAALKRFEALYEGTWSLDPKMDEFKVIELQPGAAQLYAPITFMIAPAGQTAQPTRFLMNIVLVKVGDGWKVSSILPIPAPPQ
jgi:hypothetical protein